MVRIKKLKRLNGSSVNNFYVYLTAREQTQLVLQEAG